jgi:hypothetical protein
MIYIPNFMKIGAGVQAILRFSVNNFYMVFLSTPLSWAKVAYVA